MHNPTLRVLEILNLLCATPEPMRLSQISRELNMPKSTLVPILQTLVSEQYLVRDTSEQYIPGYALLKLGAAARSVYSASGSIREALEKLAGKYDETCYYGVPEEGWVRYVEKVDSTQSLRMLTTIGHRLPAYATGIGKALLMDKSPEQLQQLYPEGLKPLTCHTVTDMEALLRQLQKARELGYAWEVEESTEHIRCFGVPVRKNGETVGAVSMAVPIFRYREAQKKDIVKALQETARTIETALYLL
jgi:DNA-binding IclR family transcriptional regulator